ncbi:MAG: 4-hydroxy-tetrahydrodipicolinate reductase, partial [Pseudomonadota bacterium]
MAADPIDIAVTGASGRMGRMLARAVLEEPGCRLVAATDRPGAEAIGSDIGPLIGEAPMGVIVEDDPLPGFARVRAVIDFTTPDASVEHAALAAQARLIHVIGTTGFSPEHLAAVAAAARHATIVRAGNMSLGVNLLVELVRQAA